LQELEEEKEELKEFQQSDKERRCLEYALFSRDLQDVTAAMEEVRLFQNREGIDDTFILRLKKRDSKKTTITRRDSRLVLKERRKFR
jgi:chromosome segregation ATPase